MHYYPDDGYFIDKYYFKNECVMIFRIIKTINDFP